MTEYEKLVIRTWLLQDAKPLPLAIRLTTGLTGRIKGVLRTAAWAKGPRATQFFERLRSAAREAIIRTLEQAATAQQLERVERELRTLGSQADTATAIRMLPLQVKDETARRLAKTQTVHVATEGAVAGLVTSVCELAPGLQGFVVPALIADMTATMYMMAQSAVQIGYSYGYSLHTPDDLPHFLVAMAPHTDEASLLDAKLTAHLALRESGILAARAVGEHLTVRMLSANNMAFSKLIDTVASRMALYLAEKELGFLLPIAGAVLQGSVNAAFAHASYLRAARYFQRLHFIDRYGEEYLETQLLLLRGVLREGPAASANAG